MRWVFLLLFGKHFWNYLQMPSKCSNIMSSLCEIFLRKYSMLGTDEVVECSFYITNCWYTFSNANGIEKPQFLDKMLVQFNHKNHCCNTSLNKMVKR